MESRHKSVHPSCLKWELGVGGRFCVFALQDKLWAEVIKCICGRGEKGKFSRPHTSSQTWPYSLLPHYCWNYDHSPSSPSTLRRGHTRLLSHIRPSHSEHF
ncbi:hypothetical protein FKM82_028705 [Ascaphus truei]